MLQQDAKSNREHMNEQSGRAVVIKVYKSRHDAAWICPKEWVPGKHQITRGSKQSKEGERGAIRHLEMSLCFASPESGLPEGCLL